MSEPIRPENERYQRLQEIFAAARQRYLQAGGDPTLSGGSLNQQDYLTDAEKQEIRELGQLVFERDQTNAAH